MKVVLDEMLRQVPGSLGAAIVGLDGIAVEYATNAPDVNMEVVSAEGISLVRRAGWKSSGENAETPEEIAVASSTRLTILRALGSGYFLCLVAGPATIPGQARYEAWRAGERLREALGG